MARPIIQVERVRKVFSYLNPDPNSNAADMWADYILGLLGRRSGSFAAQRTSLVALDDLSLTVNPGEFFALLGPNGAGKTTLVKILATLLRPTAGRVLVNGFDSQRETARVRASLAVVPAAGWLAFDAGISLGANLRYWARLYGLDRRTAEQRIGEALGVVGLAGWEKEHPEHLSSGMRGRLAIAKGLLLRAPVFLLDEPTANIDPTGAYQIRDFIHTELNRRLGQTVVLTTHNMAEAEQLADRVAIVDQGRLVACDRPAALVATLTGSILVLTVAACPPTAVRVLREDHLVLHHVETLDAQGTGRLRLHLAPGTDAATVAAALAAQGTQVQALEEAPPTLEDVFIRATGRSLDDPGETDRGA